MKVYPIVLDAPFGLGVSDQEEIMKQSWFGSFSDFFGSPAIWVDTSLYQDAVNFFRLRNIDILCV